VFNLIGPIFKGQAVQDERWKRLVVLKGRKGTTVLRCVKSQKERRSHLVSFVILASETVMDIHASCRVQKDQLCLSYMAFFRDGLGCSWRQARV
jgi:hypothetical protein